MKRVIVATILGLAASVASSYGQASYFFNTYLPLIPTAQYGVNGAGQVFFNGVLDDGTHGLVANLLYSTTTGSSPSGIVNPAPVAVNQYGAIEGGAFDFDSFYVDNTPITFTIQVWQGPGITFADAAEKGSISWTDPGQVTGAGADAFHAAPFFAAGRIVVVPEPTTLALAGLGLAGMMIFRKTEV